MPASFGQFSVGPDGRFIDAAPRPKFKLLADFGFKDPQGLVWQVPAGTVVDGASIPRTFWSVIGGPFDGNYLCASVVHDHFCVVRTRSAEATHRAFYLGMRAKGVPDPQAKKMFWAVSTFGPRWRLSRVRAEGDPVAVPLPDVDLDDPALEQEAWRRFEAVSASLEATDGARFPTDSGLAEASLESLEADAARVRGAVAGEDGPR
jgi:hypothetical protein